MPKECAFCPHTGKLSLEHIIPKWINPLFPGKKLFSATNQAGDVVRQYTDKKIDWTAKVVCKSCNETWMSNIENQHAKPVMTDLIIGKVDIPIPQSSARSIALFAFNRHTSYAAEILQ
jgi:hypothetical protein